MTKTLYRCCYSAEQKLLQGFPLPFHTIGMRSKALVYTFSPRFRDLGRKLKSRVSCLFKPRSFCYNLQEEVSIDIVDVDNYQLGTPQLTNMTTMAHPSDNMVKDYFFSAQETSAVNTSLFLDGHRRLGNFVLFAPKSDSSQVKDGC